MNDSGRSRMDELLDLLTDEVAKRLAARAEPQETEASPQPAIAPTPVQVSALEAPPPPAVELVEERAAEAEPGAVLAPHPAVSTPSHAASLMARLAVGILIAIVLINIPLNAQGTALARSIPSSASLVIANGLIVKEATSPDIYVYKDDAFHWITTLDAFDYFGYRWQNVHVVEAGFMSQFPKGAPIYVLLKCDGSPHIYQLDAGHKRWIVDIATFTAEGYVWQDVKIVPCRTLHNLLDGDSIPPGRGTPPPPLP
jgi:hypothetical protein